MSPAMVEGKLRLLVAILVILIAFVTPYSVGWNGAWWKFIPASAVIILIWRWAKPETYAANLGLRFDRRSLGTAAFVLAAVATVAAWLIPLILTPLGYVPGPASHHLGWKSLAVFQALNEEMLFRAMLLTALTRFLRSGWTVSIVAATIFVAMHFAFYRYGMQRTSLHWEALLTLFLFALACNTLFVKSGNIAIPYAIHVGWNLTRFGSDWVVATSKQPLQEAVGFNLIEGNHVVIGFAFALAVFGLLFGVFQKRSIDARPRFEP